MLVFTGTSIYITEFRYVRQLISKETQWPSCSSCMVSAFDLQLFMTIDEYLIHPVTKLCQMYVINKVWNPFVHRTLQWVGYENTTRYYPALWESTGTSKANFLLLHPLAYILNFLERNLLVVSHPLSDGQGFVDVKKMWYKHSKFYVHLCRVELWAPSNLENVLQIEQSVYISLCSIEVFNIPVLKLPVFTLFVINTSCLYNQCVIIFLYPPIAFTSPLEHFQLATRKYDTQNKH